MEERERVLNDRAGGSLRVLGILADDDRFGGDSLAGRGEWERGEKARRTLSFGQVVFCVGFYMKRFGLTGVYLDPPFVRLPPKLR